MAHFFLWLLIHLLFDPWFFFLEIIEWVRRLLPGYDFLGALLFLGLVLLAYGFLKKKLGERESKTAKLLNGTAIAALAFGLLGGLCNFIAIASNNFSMPMTGIGDPKIHFVWLTDWMRGTSPNPIKFLLRPKPFQYASPGDLMIATWFLLSWWTIIAAALAKSLSWFWSKKVNGTAAIVVFLGVQTLDGILTFLGITIFGSKIEESPLLLFLILKLGLKAALVSTKFFAGAMGLFLWKFAKYHTIWILTLVYLLGAIIPWIFLFLSHIWHF